MKLMDIINRKPDQTPWTEGEKIPWDEPEFSKRMLHEHLSQDHDAASRRFAIIDAHVAWIHHILLNDQPSNVLDLACGPGLYTSRLAKLGHTCTGIDFSPASIDYAIEQDVKAKLGCKYIHHDVRTADFGEGFDFAMLIYCEFNTFQKPDGRAILEKARQALKPDGKLLIELNSKSTLQSYGQATPSWHTEKSGLFSDRPHLFLEDSFWNEELQAATRRMYIIDAATGEVQQTADNHQAYTEEQLHELALACGFTKAEVYSKWPIEGLPGNNYSVILVAEK
jgi:SAM-dependent methyltransferase